MLLIFPYNSLSYSFKRRRSQTYNLTKNLRYAYISFLFAFKPWLKNIFYFVSGLYVWCWTWRSRTMFFALGFLESSKLCNLEFLCLAKSKCFCFSPLCLVPNIEAQSKKILPKSLGSSKLEVWSFLSFNCLMVDLLNFMIVEAFWMHYCKNFEVRKDLTTEQRKYFSIPLPLCIFNLSFLVNIVYMKIFV